MLKIDICQNVAAMSDITIVTALTYTLYGSTPMVSTLQRDCWQQPNSAQAGLEDLKNGMHLRSGGNQVDAQRDAVEQGDEKKSSGIENARCLTCSHPSASAL